MRISSVRHVVCTSCIGPPMMKNKSFVPSFFRAFARISEPVISAIVVLLVCRKGGYGGKPGFPSVGLSGGGCFLHLPAVARRRGEVTERNPGFPSVRLSGRGCFLHLSSIARRRGEVTEGNLGFP